MKTLNFCLILAICILGSCNSDNEIDYRDKYIGAYEFTIYTYNLIYDGTTVIESHDTINIMGNIDKFYGYSVNNGANYIDVEHKILILFGDTSNQGYSSCNEFIYRIYPGSMHPTITNNGLMKYPEFTCGAHDAYFYGDAINDSIKILYGVNYNDEMWHTKILGQKRY